MKNRTILALAWTAIVVAFACCEKTVYDAEKAPQVAIAPGSVGITDPMLWNGERYVLSSEIHKPMTAKDSLDAAQSALLREIWQCERDLNKLKQMPAIRAGSSLEVLHGPPQ